MRKLLTTTAVAAAISLGSASMAQAAQVFSLTLADPTAGLSGSPYGEVDVTGAGSTSMDITVLLYGTNEFHWTKDTNHHALVFDLVGNPSITISGLPSPFTVNGVQAAGADSATPFGNFDYDINFPKGTGAMPVIHSFSFTVTSTSALVLEPTHTSTYGDVYFATDIVQPSTGKTGDVGALLPAPPPHNTFVPTVPEPTTWALMILGFGGVGSLLRRTRRQGGLVAAAA